MNRTENTQDQREQGFIVVPEKHHLKQKEINSLPQKSVTNMIKKQPVNQNIPEKVKENTKAGHHNKLKGKRPQNGQHFLDRQSGMAFNGDLRKNGGGKGNIGNLDDELKRSKYGEDIEEFNPEDFVPEHNEQKLIIEDQSSQQNQKEVKHESHKFELNPDEFPTLA